MSTRIIPPDTLYNDVTFGGSVTFGGDVNVPNGTFDYNDLSSTAGILYTQTIPMICIDRQIFAENVTVEAVASQYMHVVRGTSGTNVALRAYIGSVAGATDNTVTIDLQATTAGSSAFATVLSNTIVFRSTGNNSIYTPVAATFASTGSDMAAGDVYRLVVTVGGSTATQPKGLGVQWYFTEAPS